MKKFMQKKLNQKGLTLVELLAVIVILGIIAAIAVPSIGNIIENSRYSAVKSDALNVLSASNIYFAENGDKTVVKIEDLIEDGYLETAGALTTGTITKGKQTKIVAGPVIYSGKKNVTFDNTVSDINNDKQKGSADGDKTIPTTDAGA